MGRIIPPVCSGLSLCLLLHQESRRILIDVDSPQLSLFNMREQWFSSELLALSLRRSDTLQRKLISAAWIHHCIFSVTTQRPGPQLRTRTEFHWFRQSFTFRISSLLTTTVQYCPQITHLPVGLTFHVTLTGEQDPKIQSTVPAEYQRVPQSWRC